jgi:hypothetical protein
MLQFISDETYERIKDSLNHLAKQRRLYLQNGDER